MSLPFDAGDRLLTRPQAAELLLLKPQTLAKWQVTGQYLPVIHVGRSVRYKMSDVMRLINDGTRQSQN